MNIRRALPGFGLIALIAAGLTGPAAAQRVFREYEDGSRRALTDEDIRRLSIEQNRRRDDVYDGRERPPGVRDDDDAGPSDDDDVVEYDDGDDDEDDDDRRRTYEDGDEDGDEIYEPEDRSDGGFPGRDRLTDPQDSDAHRFNREISPDERPIGDPGSAAARGQPADRDPQPQSGAPAAKPPAATLPDPAARPQQAQKPGWKPAMGSGSPNDGT